MNRLEAMREFAELLEKTGRFEKDYGTSLNHASEIIEHWEKTEGRGFDQEMYVSIWAQLSGSAKK
jgi:hypothetical protein